MKHQNHYSEPLGKADIEDQFQGLEVVFDDKVTLFPVQVKEKDRPGYEAAEWEVRR